LMAHRFRFCFSPLTGCFSPFPHGTGSLPVITEYLALGDGPAGFRRNVTCSAVLRIHSGGNFPSTTGLLPSLADRSRPVRLENFFVTPKERPTTPKAKPSGLVWFRFARRHPRNRDGFLFLRVLRCFSSPGIPRTSYVFRCVCCSITSSGLPHSEIPGSMSTYDSPGHIGVSPVLHRLLVPRHPPCALGHLTKNILVLMRSYLVFKVQTAIVTECD